MDLTRRLTDGELLDGAKCLAARERDTVAELIAHLAEIETRGLHLTDGHGSMFVYCRDVLLLPENEAYNRIEVARAAQRFPVIFDLLAQGAVNLTAVRLLAPRLTAENHAHVLESARGLKRPQVEALVARLAPKPDVATTIRKLPAPKAAPVPEPTPAEGLFGPVHATPRPSTCGEPAGQPPIPLADLPATATLPTATLPADVPTTHVPTAPNPNARAVVRPLSPDRYKLQLTISGDTLEKLRLAKDMLRHALPSGDDGALLERALDALLVDLAKKKFAATDRPRKSKPANPESRHVPAEVKRTVWVRDLGRCAFVGKKGHRCHERAFLEFHHVQPYAEAGLATPANIELRCRQHNRHEWTQYAADRFRCEMDDYESGATRFRTSPRAAPTSGTSAPPPAAR